MKAETARALFAGEIITAYILATVASGTLRVLAYGGIVTPWRVPDRQSRFADIVLIDDVGLQSYSGRALDGSVFGKSGPADSPPARFRLKCQGCPPATTQPGTHNLLAHPDCPQRRRTIHALSVA